jgi:hypothetical protein
MGDTRTHSWDFVERHAWQVFLALGVIYILFGSSDLSEATTYDSKVAALNLLVIGLFGTAIGVTALRQGARWAWLTMFAWPIYGLAFPFFQLSRPFATVDLLTIAWIVVFVVVPVLALALSARRYLRSGE